MVGIYCRVSDESQKENYSLGDQERLGREWAVSVGEEFVVYREIASASTVAKRPMFVRLLDDVRSGRITKVWFISFERRSRNLRDVIDIRDVFTKTGAEVYEFGSRIDLDDPTSVLVDNVKGSVAQFQRDRIAQLSSIGRKSQRDAGKFVHSRLFGYARQFAPDGHKVWQVVPDQAVVVRRIFSLHLEGSSFSAIARSLNDAWMPVEGRRLWRHDSISRLLRKPEYAGLAYNSRGKLIQSAIYAAIVESETWERVQTTWVRSALPRKRVSQGRSPITGIIKCAECGASYYRMDQKSHGGRRYLMHRNTKTCSQRKYLKNDITQAFAEWVFWQTYQDETASRELAVAQRANQVDEELAETERLRSLASKCDLRMKNLVRAIAEGTLQEDEAATLVLEVRQEQAAARKKLGSILCEGRDEGISSYAKVFSQKRLLEYGNGNVAQRRSILLAFYRSATFQGGVVTLENPLGGRFSLNVFAPSDETVEAMKAFVSAAHFGRDSNSRCPM